MIKKVLKGEKGFTLIELLVVVAIIGILVAIAIPQFANYKKQAADSGAEADVRNLALAMESYYATNNTYPAAATAPTTIAGFKATKNVTTAISSATATSFVLTGTSSAGTTGKTYTWDSAAGGLQ